MLVQKNISRAREGYHMIKGSFYHDDVKILIFQLPMKMLQKKLNLTEILRRNEQL